MANLAEREAEQQVLGALLIDPTRLESVTAIGLSPEDFINPAHAVIFRAFLDVQWGSEEIEDPRGAISRALRDAGCFNDTTIRALSSAEEGTLSAANVLPNARLVREAGIRRRHLQALDAAREVVTDPNIDADSLHEEIGRRLLPTLQAAAESSTKPRRFAWLDEEWLTIEERGGWLDQEPPARRYLLRSGPDTYDAGMLVAGRVGLVAAAGGVGKSMALTQLAASVATGLPWLGTFGVNARGNVLLALAEEDEEEIRRRLYYAVGVMGLTAEHRLELQRRIVPLPLIGRDVVLTTIGEDGESSPTPLLEELTVRLAEREWALLIFDPLSRFAGPDVETDNAAATRLIQAFERFTEAPGNPAVLIAHHTSKGARKAGLSEAEGVSPRGSSALVDGARWLATLTPRRHPRGAPDNLPRQVEFRVEKSNYGAFPEPVILSRCINHNGALRPVLPWEAKAYADALMEEAAEEKTQQAAINARVRPNGRERSSIGRVDSFGSFELPEDAR